MSDPDFESHFFGLSRDELLQPDFSVADIIVVQSVAMGVAYKKARTSRPIPNSNMHSFAIYDRTDEDKGKALFLSGVIGRVHFDQWRMRISFLNWNLDEECKRSSVREDYYFDWLKSGNRQGWYAITERNVDDVGQLNKHILYSSPVDSQHCNLLIEDMSSTIDRYMQNV